MVHRRTVLRAGGVSIAAVAGCLGGGGSGGADTETSTPTETPDVPEDAVIAYADLSPDQQAAFEQAREGTVVFSSSLPEGAEREADFGIGVAVPFREHDYVRKEGRLYELRVAGPTRISGTRVEVEPTEASDDAIDLANRTGEGYDLVRRAIEGDGTAEGMVERPDGVGTGDVVVYEGEHYEVTHLSLRDYGYFEMTVERM